MKIKKSYLIFTKLLMLAINFSGFSQFSLYKYKKEIGFIHKPSKRISLQTEFGLNYGPEKEKTSLGGKSTWINNGCYLSTQKYLSFQNYYYFK